MWPFSFFFVDRLRYYLPRKTRDLVPVPSFPSCCCAWKVVTRGVGRESKESSRRSWMIVTRVVAGLLEAIVRSTSDGWRWWRQLLWFIVPGFTSIYSSDLYICVYFVPGVIDLSIHTGMRFCIGINVKVLCIYKYRFRFVVGRIECNDVTETGESRSVSILFHLT